MRVAMLKIRMALSLGMAAFLSLTSDFFGLKDIGTR